MTVIRGVGLGVSPYGGGPIGGGTVENEGVCQEAAVYH